MSEITRRAVLCGAGACAITAPAHSESVTDPASVPVISWPRDRESINGSFWCRFDLRCANVARGDRLTERAYLLIGTAVGRIAPSAADRTSLPVGAAQTETRVALPPGYHTLQLVAGDVDSGWMTKPCVSRRIGITVI